MGNHLAVSATAAGGVGKLIVAQRFACLLALDFARCLDCKVLFIFLELVRGFLQDHVLELVDGHKACVAAEEGSGRGVGAGVEGTGVRVAGDDGDAVHRELEDFGDYLGRDGVKTGSYVGSAAVEDDGSVGFQLGYGFGVVKAGETGALHDHGKALADLPVGILALDLLAPLYHVAALADGFIEATGTDRNDCSFPSFTKALEDLKHVAFIDMVLQHHLLVVHAQLVGKLGHGHHEAVGTLGRSVALVGACRRCVGVEDLQVVSHVVALEQRQCLGTAVHGNGKAVVAVRSGVGADLHVDTGDLSVLVSGHLHVDAHGVSCGVGDELLLTGVVAEDRTACDEGGVAGQVLDEDILLGAVATADAGLDDVYPVLGKTGDPSYDSPHMVRNLCGGVDSETAAFHPGEADVGLKRSVLDLGRLVGCLDDGIGMGESFVHVSDLTLVGGGDVLVDIGMERELVDDLSFPEVACLAVVFREVGGGSGAVFDYSVVDKRGSGSHGLFYREDCRKDFVVHLDLLHRLFGGFKGFGYDGGNTVTDVADLHVEEPSVMR